MPYFAIDTVEIIIFCILMHVHLQARIYSLMPVFGYSDKEGQEALGEPPDVPGERTLWDLLHPTQLHVHTPAQRH